MTAAADAHQQLRDNLGKAIVGQEEVLTRLFMAVLCSGHVLLEGVPGTAKTLMARALAASLARKFTRVQFTPDLLPSDIIGTSVFRPDTATFEFREGPLFTDTLLADEINRAPAKTQAALLEAMEERRVTTDGVGRALAGDFLVVATQNPVEYEGTYPLPEAQLDRFLFKIEVPLPSSETEADMLRRIEAGFDPRDLGAAGVTVSVQESALEAARAEVKKVTLSDAVLGYITAIIGATRTSPDLLLGASPRGSIALMRASKALAAISGRDFVIPEDVKDVAVASLRHRVTRRPEAEIAGVGEAAVIERVLARVPVPR